MHKRQAHSEGYFNTFNTSNDIFTDFAAYYKVKKQY